MITSDRQVAVTKEKIQDLLESLRLMEKDTRTLIKASKIQIEVLIEDLNAEIKEYESLKTKGLEAIEISDLSDIMLLPIKYRIAKRMTQELFAKKVDMPLRMICRYESENYRNITGGNLYKILDKLHLKIFGKIKEA